MAEFEVKVYKLTIEKHPNADRLELAVVGDYRSIVMKGQFKTGDLGVYIPEASVCPEWLITELGLEGKLAGKKHNRVKAVKLRGILSQGLIYPLVKQDKKVLSFDDENGRPSWTYVEEGDDVTEHLGITKYEPPIPIHMQGEVFNAHGRTLSYDIENYKKYPDILVEGEDVIMTEKIHGTWCCFGYHPALANETYIIASKGLSGQGLAFKVNEANKNNLYIRALDGTANANGANVLDRAMGFWGGGNAFYILGEVYGPGVQKGFGYGAVKPQFRVFDIYWGYPHAGEYADADILERLCLALEVEKVPEVYRGPFSRDTMMDVTQGREIVSGNEVNMREGVVVRPFKERRDYVLGRVILKSVGEEYLLRKGGTEYN